MGAWDEVRATRVGRSAMYIQLRTKRVGYRESSYCNLFEIIEVPVLSACNCSVVQLHPPQTHQLIVEARADYRPRLRPRIRFHAVLVHHRLNIAPVVHTLVLLEARQHLELPLRGIRARGLRIWGRNSGQPHHAGAGVHAAGEDGDGAESERVGQLASCMSRIRKYCAAVWNPPLEMQIFTHLIPSPLPVLSRSGSACDVSTFNLQTPPPRSSSARTFRRPSPLAGAASSRMWSS